MGFDFDVRVTVEIIKTFTAYPILWGPTFFVVLMAGWILGDMARWNRRKADFIRQQITKELIQLCPACDKVHNIKAEGKKADGSFLQRFWQRVYPSGAGRKAGPPSVS